MVFQERITILTLQKNGTNWTWEAGKKLWSGVERTGKTNIFARNGLGASTVVFTLPKIRLTLYQAIRWRGKHCFLTDITSEGPVLMRVTAALAEPERCTAKKTAYGLDELNTPVEEEETFLTFPACLVEKYLGYQQLQPQAMSKTRFVLVTPREILLHSSQLVEVGGTNYTVETVHTLDEFKNEYEIYAEDDEHLERRE